MAAGYAASRPPLHRRIVERASVALGSPRRALDIGCGAGLSTRALEGLASHCVGLEPAEAMLRWTRGIAPQANFVLGRAEALPFAGRSFDLLTAAGSLNYVAGLDLFFGEAARVLDPRGRLLVYDFRKGRSFPHSEALAA